MALSGAHAVITGLNVRTVRAADPSTFQLENSLRQNTGPALPNPHFGPPSQQNSDRRRALHRIEISVDFGAHTLISGKKRS
jgi:hypothetical protein